MQRKKKKNLMKGYTINHMKKRIILLTVLISLWQSFTVIDAQEKIIGPDQVMIPYTGESIAHYQIPKEYTIVDISVSGVTINQEGLLTITKEAHPQTITIIATYQKNSYQKQINLYHSWSYQKEEFKKYQMKQSIQPITIPSLYVNTIIHQMIRYITMIISTLIFIGYCYKRKERD